MSTAGFNSQNGTGQSYANGPSQNPVAPHQQPGVGYGSTPQPTYNPMQAKAAPPPGPPGPYPVCSYQPGAPFASYPAPLGQSVLTRPMMGGPPSHTPPQSASPGPRLPPAQATPPPAVSSSSYYTNPQQPPAWQYNTAPPPMGAPTSISTPPRGPAPPHVHPTSSSTGSSSTAYSPAARPPHVSHGVSQPPGMHRYPPPGPAPPSMTPMTTHAYQPNQAPYGPPPTGPMPSMNPAPPPMGPPMAHAAPQPPQAEGSGPPAPTRLNHVDGRMGGPSQPGPPGRHLGGHYPSLPPGYQNAAPPPAAMHPAIQAATQPYTQGPQPYPQPLGGPGPAQLSPSLAVMSLQSRTPETLRVVNLLQERNLLPPTPIPPPTPCLQQDLQKINCHPEVFRSTLTSIPQTQALLNKAKMPLGLLLHPFKDLSVPPPCIHHSV